jgi:hypothetical protein
LDITPDIDTSTVNITVFGSAAAQSGTVHLVISDKQGHKVLFVALLHALSVQPSIAALPITVTSLYVSGRTCQVIFGMAREVNMVINACYSPDKQFY